MGAVMGAKQLKAIVLHSGAHPPVADPGRCAAITASYALRMLANDLTRWQLEPPGFGAWVRTHGTDGRLCHRNYRDSEFKGPEEAYIDLVVQDWLPRVARERGLVDMVDAYCEGIAFSATQCDRLFAAAKAHGWPLRLHTEQISNIGGSRMLSNAGTNNLFAGVNAGAVNAGSQNSFVGASAGQANTTGQQNSFFGYNAGLRNTIGNFNPLAGQSAGQETTIKSLFADEHDDQLQ